MSVTVGWIEQVSVDLPWINLKLHTRALQLGGCVTGSPPDVPVQVKDKSRSIDDLLTFPELNL